MRNQRSVESGIADAEPLPDGARAELVDVATLRVSRFAKGNLNTTHSFKVIAD